MTLRRLAALSLGASAWLAHGPLRAADAVVVRVVEQETTRPLANADVTDLATGTRRFTNERGETSFSWPATGVLHLRARQIGYRFADRELRRDASPAPDTVVVALAHLAYELRAVRTIGTAACGRADSLSSMLAADALDQLRVAAERYDAFRRAYPFDFVVRRRTVTRDDAGRVLRVTEQAEHGRSDRWEERYEAGRMLHDERGGFSVTLLYLSNLADSSFWEHHCFTMLGVEQMAEGRVLHLRFDRPHDARGPEWSGSAYIDSTTSMLRRVEFTLEGLDPSRAPVRLEGFTSFQSPSPYITIPDSIVAIWWRNPPRSSAAMPDVAQLLHITELHYRKNTPAPTP